MDVKPELLPEPVQDNGWMDKTAGTSAGQLTQNSKPNQASFVNQKMSKS
jgi:hypothetical protein